LQNFQKELVAFFTSVKTLQNPRVADIGNISGDNADLILFSLYSRTFGGHRSQFQWARINKIFSRLTESGLPIVALIFGNPFFISKLNNWKRSDALFLLYSYVESSQLAVFDAIASFKPVNGQLPVKINAGRSRISASSLPEKSYTLNFDTNVNRELPEAEEAIAKAIVQRIFPGGVLLIAHKGEVVHWKGYGKYDYDKPDGLQAQRVFPETNYDLASLTKVLATTPAILRLNDLGQIKLTDRLSDFYPALGHDWPGSVSIADLLAHQSGFPAWKPFYENVSGTEAVIQSVLKTQPEYDPGILAVYSDLGFILLGDIITRVTGEPLDIYCRNSVFQPLGLHSLHYIPAKADETGIIKQKTSCPPTGFEKFRNRLIQGEVNDANCFAMGGMAGHAGLFGNALDAAAMGQMFLNRGIYNRRRFLNFSTARQAVQPFKPDISRRALGWDMPDAESSAGKYFSPQSYGHLAFTGPSMWIDPAKDLIVVFLCNRTRPDPNNNRIREIRPLLHDTVILSLRRMGLLD
ncbi:MAG: serine hydrolase, partial [Calditrichia bacterium]